MAIAVILFFNAGVFPNRNSQSSAGSQTQANLNGALLLLAIGFVWFVKIRRKLGGKPRKKWPFPNPPFDHWLGGNLIRPATIVLVLAELRALAHFSDSSLAVSAQAAVYVAGGLSFIYIFVFGPLVRPQTVLSSMAPFDPQGTYSGSVSAQSLPPVSHALLTPVEIRKMTFPRTLKGYSPHEVESLLNATATRIEHGEAISAMELSEVRFPLSINGYRVQDVDAFLDRLGRPLS
jgi:DivIVA domain-containing protein